MCVGLEAAIVISVDEYRDQYSAGEHEDGSSSVLLSWVEVRSSSKTDHQETDTLNVTKAGLTLRCMYGVIYGSNDCQRICTC